MKIDAIDFLRKIAMLSPSHGFEVIIYGIYLLNSARKNNLRYCSVAEVLSNTGLEDSLKAEIEFIINPAIWEQLEKIFELYGTGELLKEAIKDSCGIWKSISISDKCKDTARNMMFSSFEIELDLLAPEGVACDVCDIGSGLGNFILAAGSDARYKSARIHGIEIDRKVANMCKLRADVAGVDCNVVEGDVLSSGFFVEAMLKGDKKYDRIFCDPGFGRRIEPGNVAALVEICKNLRLVTDSRFHYEWLFAAVAHEMLKDGGRAVVVVPEGILSLKFDSMVRQQLIRRGMIEAVITFHRKRLFMFTPVSYALVVLRRAPCDTIKFVKNFDPAKLSISEALKNAVEVNKSDIYDDCDLHPLAYDKTMEFKNSVPLSELIESACCGTSFSKKKFSEMVLEGLDEAESQYELESVLATSHNSYVITYKSLPDVIHAEDVEPYTPSAADKSIDGKYMAEVGDIIITKTGSPIKVAVVGSLPENCPVYVNRNLFLIKLNKSKMMPYYLKYYFSSSYGTKALEGCIRGLSNINISLEKLLQLKVPYKSFENVLKISGSVEAHYNEIREAYQKINAVKRIIQNSVDSDFADMIAESSVHGYAPKN